MILTTILISIGILFIVCLIISAIIVIKYTPDSDNINNLKDAILNGNEKWRENQDTEKKIGLEKFQKERNKWLKNGKIYKYVEKALINDNSSFWIATSSKKFITIDAINSIPGFHAESSRYNDEIKVTWRL